MDSSAFRGLETFFWGVVILLVLVVGGVGFFCGRLSTKVELDVHIGLKHKDGGAQ